MASKCISKLGQLQRPSDLQTRSIMASECNYEFTRSPCGETLELEGRQPIINTPPHLAWHLKGIRQKERFWLEERRQMVKGSKYIVRIYESSARVYETKSLER